VIEFLKGYDLVNDEKWAQAYTSDRLRRKQISTSMLERELKQKGVTREVIEQTVSKLNTEETDEDRAFAAAEKRWPRIEKESDPMKRKQKLMTYLAGRGFSFSVIATVYKRLTSEPLEEID